MNTSVQLSNGTRVTYTYTSERKRMKRQSATQNRTYVYDGNNLFAEIDASFVVQVIYALEPLEHGRLISQRIKGSGADLPASYHHYDALGSTIALSGPTAVVTDTYVYTAFGETKASTGTTTNLLTWVGELGYIKEVETGEHQAGKRPVQPALARWKSEDPLGPTTDSRLNPFGYVENNPVNEVDPSGMDDKAGFVILPKYNARVLEVLGAVNPDLNGFVGFINERTSIVERYVGDTKYFARYSRVIVAVRTDEVKTTLDWEPWFKGQAGPNPPPAPNNQSLYERCRSGQGSTSIAEFGLLDRVEAALWMLLEDADRMGECGRRLKEIATNPWGLVLLAAYIIAHYFGIGFVLDILASLGAALFVWWIGNEAYAIGEELRTFVAEINGGTTCSSLRRAADALEEAIIRACVLGGGTAGGAVVGKCFGPPGLGRPTPGTPGPGKPGRPPSPAPAPAAPSPSPSPRVNMDHIGGELVGAKPKGGHYKNARLLIRSETPHGVDEVYEARIAVRDATGHWIGNKFSTMFPDSWSKSRILQEVQEAYIDAGSPATPNTYWKGTSKSGLAIQGYTMNPNKPIFDVETAYPVK